MGMVKTLTGAQATHVPSKGSASAQIGTDAACHRELTLEANIAST
jgi:hypothetical protein